MTKRTYHINIFEDAMEKIYWAKTKALTEQKNGLSKAHVKSHSDTIMWMYEKIQELSKALKGKIAAEQCDKEKEKKEDGNKNEDEDKQSP